eukprot:3937533-Rhodomonas_salina.3
MLGRIWGLEVGWHGVGGWVDWGLRKVRAGFEVHVMLTLKRMQASACGGGAMRGTLRAVRGEL